MFGQRLVLAAKADMLSLTSFEIGLFGWMALMAFVFYPAPNRLAHQCLVDPPRHQGS